MSLDRVLEFEIHDFAVPKFLEVKTIYFFTFPHLSAPWCPRCHQDSERQLAAVVLDPQEGRRRPHVLHRHGPGAPMRSLDAVVGYRLRWGESGVGNAAVLLPVVVAGVWWFLLVWCLWLGLEMLLVLEMLSPVVVVVVMMVVPLVFLVMRMMWFFVSVGCGVVADSMMPSGGRSGDV